MLKTPKFLSVMARAFRLARLLVVSMICAFLSINSATADIRLKDIVEVEGVRGNDLVGYGLVVGLDGTGDTIRNSPYTEEALSNILERLGVNIQGSDFRPNNVAAVLVTATLPPFGRKGSRIDINVASIGDAKNLAGGSLVMTPLNAADGNVYAVAQGNLIVSGFKAEGNAGSVTEGVPTSATIPNGARIEKEVAFDFQNMRTIKLALRDPDFTTAGMIETKINEFMGRNIATFQDAGTVELSLATLSENPAQLIRKLENLRVTPETKARVVIDQRSGTIVLGDNVKVSAVAIAQGNLSIKISERPQVSQPNPFGYGDTVSVPRTDINVYNGPPGNIAIVNDTVTLPDLVAGLNALGVSPREMIDILKTIKTAGALHAELVLQ